MRSLCAGTASVILTALVGLGARQNQTGAISGLITDTTGRELPGAAITAVSNSVGTQTTVTDAAGRYRLDRLPAGPYLLKVSMSGFVTRMAETTVAAGQEGEWSGALLVGHVADETSIERRVMGLAGPDARDCGRHAAPVSEAALRRSLECAVTSARLHRPFSVVVQFTRDDPQAGRGLFAGPDGFIRFFEYNQGGAKFSSHDCPSPDVSPARSRSAADFEFTCRTAKPADF